MQIKGLQKTSLIDYPGKISAVVFLPNCNFRCPFCQNPDLIENPDKIQTIEEDEFFSFLESRKKWIDGVCITGGEPCLHKELPEFAKRIKDMGFLVKVDTNGTNPLMLKDLINRKLVDYIAMDIKASKENYGKAAGVKVDIEKINQSIQIIMNSGIDYEFRTTVIPGLFDHKEAEAIGESLKGAENLFLQQFRPISTLNREFRKIRPYEKEKLEEFSNILKESIKNVEVRV